jgi:hypothetical protein
MTLDTYSHAIAAMQEEAAVLIFSRPLFRSRRLQVGRGSSV